MAERLVEVLVPEGQSQPVRDLLERSGLDWYWQQSAGAVAVFKLLKPAEEVEDILDPLEQMLSAVEGARILVLPVEAVAPRKQESAASEAGPPGDKKSTTPYRISREELYGDLSDFARITPAFLVMTALATVVTAIGFARNSPAILIAAMVIAPLLGPNMALALATTLADTDLARRAIRANLAGVLVAFTVAFGTGLLFVPDPAASEVVMRTSVSWAEIVLALAAGAAAAMAVTSGVATSLVGVMVAVALLPPLVIATALVLHGPPDKCLNAFLLLFTNVICVNLSGVATFYVRGIRPRSWWEAKKSARASKIAITSWLVLLAIVVVIVILTGVEPPGQP